MSALLIAAVTSWVLYADGQNIASMGPDLQTCIQARDMVNKQRAFSNTTVRTFCFPYSGWKEVSKEGLQEYKELDE